MSVSDINEMAEYLASLPNGTRIAIVYREGDVHYQCRFNRVSKNLSIVGELKHAHYWLSILKEWPHRSFGEVTVYYDQR